MNDVIKRKINDFFSRFNKHYFKKGEILLHPDENPQGAIYLQSGHVREYSMSPEGVEITLHVFAPNSFFPMTWVLSDIPNRYYYEALSDVDVYFAPKTAVTDFLKSEPDVLLDLTSRLLMGVDKLLTRIESLTAAKASERLISALIFLARHFGKEYGNEIRIEKKFTQREIGTLAGITRETTSREWDKLEKQQLIAFSNNEIVIKDLTYLQEQLTKNNSER